MLKEQNSVILNKALGTLLIVTKVLADDGEEISPFLYTRKNLKIRLENLGALNYV